jgi:polyisoprenoid-binding protein YceI
MLAYARRFGVSIVAERSATAIPVGTWAIDPVWSSIGFEVKKIGLATVKGRALGFEGTIHGGAYPSIAGKVAVSSITTFDETRDAHLQSPDFFDAERYPELRFVSNAVVFKGDELIVQGELGIKGVTKPVELRGRFAGSGLDLMGQDRIALELTGVIDRTEFGLDWNAPLPGGGFLLPNEVTLTASFAAARAA